MKTLKFEKDELVKTLTLDELKLTLTEEAIGRKRKRTLPVDHHAVIDMVGDKLAKHNLKMEMEDIIISKKGLARLPALDPDNKYVLNSIVVRNLVTAFNIVTFDNKNMNMKVGIGYSDFGITLAFGANIKVCSNMTIMGAENIIKSYGKRSVPFDKMIELTEKATGEMDQRWENYSVNILDMQNRELLPEDAFRLIGKLNVAAVSNAYFEKGEAPFNIGENSSFVKGLIGERMFEEKGKTFWDFMQTGTNVLTHSKSNIQNKWEALSNFGNFMLAQLS